MEAAHRLVRDGKNHFGAVVSRRCHKAGVLKQLRVIALASENNLGIVSNRHLTCTFNACPVVCAKRVRLFDAAHGRRRQNCRICSLTTEYMRKVEGERRKAKGAEERTPHSCLLPSGERMKRKSPAMEKRPKRVRSSAYGSASRRRGRQPQRAQRTQRKTCRACSLDQASVRGRSGVCRSRSVYCIPLGTLSPLWLSFYPALRPG